MAHRPHVSSSALLAVLLGAALGLGCAASPSRPSGVPLGQPFELRPGSSATMAGGPSLTFNRVLSDSRCPMDALCVWAGDAVVAVSLSHRSGSQADLELHTDPSGAEASDQTYTVRLVGLQPYPRSDRQIRDDDYVATFTVSAR